MKLVKLVVLVLVLVLVLNPNFTFAQVYSDKIIGKNNAILLDSLKTEEYPYILPILGQKLTKKGYDLPYSAGFSINYFGFKSDLEISNLNVGFNNGETHNLDQIVRFNDAKVNANSISYRPDFWLFPFLNIYGILGQGKTNTSINAGIYVPDINNNWSEILNFSSKVSFDVTAFGFGITPTIGVGGGWLALDMNLTWSDITGMPKPVFGYTMGTRLGKTFKFKKNQSNIALWAGAFRMHVENNTQGSLPLSETLPLDSAQAKVEQGFIKIDEKQTQTNNWWNSLSALDKLKPENIAKYATINKALETASNLLTSLDGALSTANESTVQYNLNKKQKDLWNFLLGAQYQYNKHFMFRVECGFLASRAQITSGIQYRFGL